MPPPKMPFDYEELALEVYENMLSQLEFSDLDYSEECKINDWLESVDIVPKIAKAIKNVIEAQQKPDPPLPSATASGK